MASSSSSSSISIFPQAKYDIFLSFRGEDTRHNFISHLHKALLEKQVLTFFDDQLARGCEISPALLNAIEESKVSVIIFSKGYASSRWCLDELVKILQCRKMHGQMVLPVFYYITPSDVRHQTGSFGDAFVEHEQRFKDMPEKVQRWRDALTEASNLSGLDISVIRHESNLVDEVVRDILEKLNVMSTSTDCQGLVGLNSRIEEIKTLLCIGLLDFRVIGIWRMGGIGKTTLAGAVYDQVSSQFESHCFIINVREELEKYGLVNLREQVLSHLLGENLKMRTPNIPKRIKQRIRCKKVLIVLDDVITDVNTLGLSEFLVGGIGHFGLGSRILITTRDKQVLKICRAHNIYEVEGLDRYEGLHLFCNYAFKQNHPLEDFVKLSKRVLDYAKGNPLALKVLGSCLCGNNKQDWESAMSNLRIIVNPQINDVLKISYERLNREQKDIFLDIACFFKGEDRYHVTKILDGCYSFSTHICLTSLMDKSLISVSDKNKIEMHDLLQEMGQEIVHQESNKKPGERSRLWYHDDVYRVLQDNKGTDSIEGIFLNMCKIRDLLLGPRAFSKMSSLRLLKFYNYELYKEFVDISKVRLPNQGLKYLPNELRYLHWDGYPSKKLPSKFSAEYLVELALPYSKLKKLWNGTKNPSRLKFIDLHGSKSLVRIPDLSNATGLESLNLQNCESLVDIHSSIQSLDNVHILNLRGCTSFRSFPGNIHFRSAITLDLSYCINLATFPQISGNVKILYLSGTPIEEVSPSIELLTELIELHMENCTRLKSLPNNVCKLESLRRLNLSDCKSLEGLPEKLGNLVKLEELDASRTVIRRLPSSISRLKQIRELNLAGCNLDVIPDSLCCMSSLEDLDLRGNYFWSLPTTFKQLSRLKYLILSNCPLLQSLPELPLHLEYLAARNCKLLQSLPKFPASPDEVDASELKRPDCYSSLVQSFVFINSLRVKKKAYNKILADAQVIFQEKAIASLTCRRNEAYNQAPGFIFCLPGRKIPDWISYQSSGSVLTIDLSQYWFNKRFLGFILGVVVGFWDGFSSLEIMCDCLFETNSGQEIGSIFFMSATESKVLFESSHLLLGFYPDFCAGIIAGEYRKLSLDFVPYESYHAKVKCCGACPLYLESNEARTSISADDSFATKSQEFGKPIEETDTDESMSDTSHEEEDEMAEINAPFFKYNEEFLFPYNNLCAGGTDVEDIGNSSITSQEFGELIYQTDTNGSRSDTSDEEDAEMAEINASLINNGELFSFYNNLNARGTNIENFAVKSQEFGEPINETDTDESMSGKSDEEDAEMPQIKASPINNEEFPSLHDNLSARGTSSKNIENFAIRSQELGEPIDQTDTNGSRAETFDEEAAEMAEMNCPPSNNEGFPSFYNNLCARGNLLFPYCRTFVVYFFCGLGVLWLLELLGLTLWRR